MELMSTATAFLQYQYMPVRARICMQHRKRDGRTHLICSPIPFFLCERCFACAVHLDFINDRVGTVFYEKGGDFSNVLRQDHAI